ncbi:hypothetical protein GCM10010400_12110 [Streptomyces aculeolatus]
MRKESTQFVGDPRQRSRAPTRPPTCWPRCTDAGAGPSGDIARAAGVGNATLSRYLPTRQALVAAVYDDPLRRLRAAAEGTRTNQPAFEAPTT